MKDLPNINAVWGALLIEELVRHGVDTFVISPGSRSTPLVIAAARHARAHCHLCIDERAAAFFALGHARGTGRPAAVITTSGTAVANLGPAVVEASHDGVPLLLLTADRPFELRDCGANQTVRQTARFRDDVRWHGELPPPDDLIPARVVLTTVARAVAQATRDPGPVQLNCQFREPLDPEPQRWDPSCLLGTERWQRSTEPFTRLCAGARGLPAAELDVQARALAGARRGLLIAAGWGADSEAASELAEALGWPLWADIRSGARLGNTSTAHLPHLDRSLRADQDLTVVQLGGRITSKRLQTALDGAEVGQHIVVDASPDRIDPGHRVSLRVHCDSATWCREIRARLGTREPSPELSELTAADRRIEAAIGAAIDGSGELSEPAVARWLTQNMRAGHGLFVSSSMPIRDLQSYGAREGPALRVAANRGASGIDGVIASAAGYSEGLGHPVTLLIGDLALLHDLGSLALLGSLDLPVTVVVLNNGGGSIFTQLPIAQYDDVFSPYFDTPHSFRFEGTARDFGLTYATAGTREAFARAYEAALDRGAASLIEVPSGLESNREHHRRIEAAAGDAVRG